MIHNHGLERSLPKDEKIVKDREHMSIEWHQLSIFFLPIVLLYQLIGEMRLINAFELLL